MTTTPTTAAPQQGGKNAGLARYNAIIQAPKTKKYLDDVLAEKKGAFVTSLTSLMANSPQLQECDALTVMYAAIKATSLGLPFDPNLGQAYCIPYDNRRKGVKEAQFQMGYKGFIQLALRTGQFARLNVTDVREGELREWDVLTGDLRLTADPDRETKPIIGYAAYFRLTNGFEKSLYWPREKCERHALRYSQTFASKNAYVKQSSKWTTDFDAMAMKTVLKQLLSKYAPMSVEMQQAAQADQSVIHLDAQGEEQYDYPDNDRDARHATTDVESQATADAIRQRAEQAMAEASNATASDAKEEVALFEEMKDEQ